jgi:ATP-dependent DNA ligase
VEVFNSEVAREDAIRLTATCIIDGEAGCCGDDGVPSFDRIGNRRHDDLVFLYAFDLIELNGARPA